MSWAIIKSIVFNTIPSIVLYLPISCFFLFGLSYFTQNSLIITNFRCLFGLYIICKVYGKTGHMNKIFVVTRNIVSPPALQVLHLQIQPNFDLGWLNLGCETQGQGRLTVYSVYWAIINKIHAKDYTWEHLATCYIFQKIYHYLNYILPYFKLLTSKQY